jgi:arylsulfatase
LVMTDDVGFGAPSTFGGVIPTPSLDRIANMGSARRGNAGTMSSWSSTPRALTSSAW